MKTCICCGAPIRLMCQTRFCGGRCETGKCHHRHPIMNLEKSPA